MIIYVVSDKNSFGGRLDVEPGARLANDKTIYDGEHYLYRQEWAFDWQGQPHLNHEDFVKVVSDKWTKDHRNYYGCTVLNDTNNSDSYLNFVRDMNL